MSTPRHRDPARFGTHIGRTWVPYEVLEGKLVFSCGHSVEVVVGTTPEVSEEEARAFLVKVAEKPCATCSRPPSRLRYHSVAEGKDQA